MCLKAGAHPQSILSIAMRMAETNGLRAYVQSYTQPAVLRSSDRCSTKSSLPCRYRPLAAGKRLKGVSSGGPSTDGGGQLGRPVELLIDAKPGCLRWLPESCAGLTAAKAFPHEAVQPTYDSGR